MMRSMCCRFYSEATRHSVTNDLDCRLKDMASVNKDILDLIKAHIEYAIENNNMAYLFNPAPQPQPSGFRQPQAVAL